MMILSCIVICDVELDFSVISVVNGDIMIIKKFVIGKCIEINLGCVVWIDWRKMGGWWCRMFCWIVLC